MLCLYPMHVVSVLAELLVAALTVRQTSKLKLRDLLGLANFLVLENWCTCKQDLVASLLRVFFFISSTLKLPLNFSLKNP